MPLMTLNGTVLAPLTADPDCCCDAQPPPPDCGCFWTSKIDATSPTGFGWEVLPSNDTCPLCNQVCDLSAIPPFDPDGLGEVFPGACLGTPFGVTSLEVANLQPEQLAIVSPEPTPAMEAWREKLQPKKRPWPAPLSHYVGGNVARLSAWVGFQPGFQ